MTGHTPQKLPLFRRNLLHHRITRGEFPYTRSIMLPFLSHFVKNNFQIFSQIFIYFFVKNRE